MEWVVRLVVAVVQVDQVVRPGVSFLDDVVEKGDFVKVPPVMGEQRVVYTEHSFGLHPRPFQAV